MIEYFFIIFLNFILIFRNTLKIYFGDFVGYFSEFLLIILLIIYFINIYIVKKTFFSKKKKIIPTIIFFCILSLYVIDSLFKKGVIHTVFSFRIEFLYIILGYMFIKTVNKSPNKKLLYNVFINSFLFFGFISLLIGLKQIFFLDAYEVKYISRLSYTYWKGRLRPIGSYADTPHYAAMALLIFQVTMITKKEFKKNVLNFISVFSIFISLSRSRIVAFFFTLLINLKNKKIYIYIILIILIFLFSNSIFLDRMQTFNITDGNIDPGIMYRLEQWKYSIENIKIFGHGLGVSTFFEQNYNVVVSDNIYFKYLNEFGILGIIIFLLFILNRINKLKKEKNNKFYFSLIGTLLITGITGQPLDSFPWNFYFICFLFMDSDFIFNLNKKY